MTETPPNKPIKPKKRWTAAEDAQLTDLYGKFHILEIVKQMGFHRSTVDDHISKLDLRRLGDPVKLAKVNLNVSKPPQPTQPATGPRWGNYTPTRLTNSTTSVPYKGKELSYRRGE